MNKYDHVRQAQQTRGHHCHWPGCRRQVLPAMWGCSQHWFTLPKILRDKVWHEYRTGQEETCDPSGEYMTVAEEVQRWIRNFELRKRIPG